MDPEQGKNKEAIRRETPLTEETLRRLAVNTLSEQIRQTLTTVATPLKGLTESTADTTDARRDKIEKLRPLYTQMAADNAEKLAARLLHLEEILRNGPGQELSIDYTDERSPIIVLKNTQEAPRNTVNNRTP